MPVTAPSPEGQRWGEGIEISSRIPLILAFSFSAQHIVVVEVFVAQRQPIHAATPARARCAQCDCGNR